jgi:predicted nucleic acid-binding protein
LRTYVLDASALLAFIEDKPGAAKLEDLLTEAHRRRARVLMSSLNFGEAYAKLLRERGRDQALRTMSIVHPLPIELVDATPQRCLHAAEVKTTYKLYYIDSFAAALAFEYKATLVTGDSDFRKLGHNFAVLWLRS